MKHTVVGLVALCSVGTLAFALHAEARGIRADNPETPGCQINNWSTNSDPYAGQLTISPGGISVGSGGTDTLVTCMSNGDNSIVNTVNPTDLTATTDQNSFFVMNGNDGSPYPMQTNEAFGANKDPSFLATSGELYQFVANSSSGVGPVDADAVVWTLSNSDTEIELNDWCTAGSSGASVTWGKNTFSGGCGNSTNDLLFNKAGVLIGYVNDLAFGQGTGPLVLVNATSLPTGWSSSAVTAPEIDPASVIAALTLLAGGLAVLRGRRTPVVAG
jgi:hypothetical protein